MNAPIRRLLERLTDWTPGSLQVEREPEGVAYTVRDPDGNILEIVTKDGMRYYAARKEEA